MRFCGACGAPLTEPLVLAPDDGEAPDAQLRHMTAMFCDVVDSTTLAEHLDPEDFRDVLDGYHAACTAAIERFNGYVAQYQGDGVVAYFGYPRAHEDDALRSVNAAMDLLDEIAALNEQLRERLHIALEVRIGLHTGMAVTGPMGSGASGERHSAVGETLHIASRAQTVAPAGSVVVTDSTLGLLGDQFETETLGTKDLKGISRPVRVHAIVRRAGRAAASGWPVSAARTPLIGRAREVALLREAWEKSQRLSGVVVHVTGEAGMGKSRLVETLREQVHEQGATQHVLQCSPHRSSTALHPARRFIERIAELDRTQVLGRQLDALARSAAAVALDPSKTVPLLADLLAIPAASRALPSMSPRDARNETLGALEALLVGDATKHPLLLVVEDLHWSDPTTVELLERIVTDAESLPIACVFTFRGDFQPPWSGWCEVVDIELGPLSAPEVRAMAAATSPASLDAEELQRVESAAEGIPLFVEEMVKSIDAEGAQRPSASRVPLTLQGLLSERLDRLPQLATLIDVAAVLGREFDRGLLEALGGLDRPGFRSALAQLTAEEVLQPVEGSHSRVEFKHALLQEVAYERLLRKRRRALHASVAEFLGTGRPSAWGAEHERIAQHWASADQPARALPEWEQAGRRALERAAFLEAAEHFREAVKALDTTRPEPEGELERGELLARLGAALQAGLTPAAGVDAIYARARSAFGRTGGRDRLILVLRGEYLFHMARAEYEAGFDLAEEMLAMARRDERTPWLAEGAFYRGFARMLRGELDPAREDLEEAIALYWPAPRSEDIFEAQSDPGVAACAYLANLLWNQGHAREAAERSDASLRLAEQVGGPVTLGLARGMRCGLALVRGLHDEFGAWLEKARRQSVDGNIGYWSTVCAIWAAWVEGLSGDARAAGARLEQHIERYLRSGGRVGLPHFQALLAEVELAGGRRARALEALATAQQHIDVAGERFYEPEVQWLTARMLGAGEEPEPDAAQAAYARAIEAARTQNATLLELRAATGLAIQQRRAGAAETALPLVALLCARLADEPDVPDVNRANALLSGGRGA
jgi:class 3 adenylate cyclase